MAEFKPNSHRYKAQEAAKKEQKKEVTKVTTGKVQRRKKSEIRKLADAFVPEDAGSMKAYILFDLLIPKAKQIAEDVFHVFLYGDESPSHRSNSSYIQYNRYSKDKNRASTRDRNSFNYNYDEILFESRAEAEKVIDCMFAHLDDYDVISVADYYEYAGVASKYTDNKYGWTSVRTAEVIRVGGGLYTIKLPKALPLD